MLYERSCGKYTANLDKSQAGLFHWTPDILWHLKSANFNQVLTISFNLSKFQNISGNQI